MKGYLKNNDGLFQLAPKVTTIGREGCDLVVQSAGIDFQHAVIEYSSEEDCFVLQDLNTAQGTYVNDCRVQNAAVRLAPNDLIRFGSGPATYELIVDNVDQVSYPPVGTQRMAWNQPLTVLPDPTPVPMSTSNNLPQLQSVVKTSSATWESNQNQRLATVPRPPATIRSRPLSAGSAGLRTITTSTQPIQHRAVAGSGWMSVGGSSIRPVNTSMNGIPSQQVDKVEINVYQEKEQRMLRLQEEIKRLAMYEMECARKEELIQTLREEIADLQGRLRIMETSHSSIEVNNSDIYQTIRQLENELMLKRTEVQSLKEQINRGKNEDNQGQISREDFNHRIAEVNSLRQELERVRKDKNITSGLVTQMQKDMSSKDTTISRLTREIESLKVDSKDKDVQLLSMQTKLEDQYKQIEETRKVSEDIEVKDKELAALRLKFKATENRLQEQSDLITSLKEELEKTKHVTDQERDIQKKLQVELDQTKTKCLDVERTERMVRVDLEQISKKLERFRNRVIQVTFSTPGIKAPDDEIIDDDLLQTLKKIVDDRTELTRQVQDLGENLKHASQSKKETTESTKKLKQQITETVDHKGGLRKS